MPLPILCFVIIQISYEIFYNRFRVVRIQIYFVTFCWFHKSMYIRLLNTAEEQEGILHAHA